MFPINRRIITKKFNNNNRSSSSSSSGGGDKKNNSNDDDDHQNRQTSGDIPSLNNPVHQSSKSERPIASTSTLPDDQQQQQQQRLANQPINPENQSQPHPTRKGKQPAHNSQSLTLPIPHHPKIADLKPSSEPPIDNLAGPAASSSNPSPVIRPSNRAASAQEPILSSTLAQPVISARPSNETLNSTPGQTREDPESSSTRSLHGLTQHHSHTTFSSSPLAFESSDALLDQDQDYSIAGNLGSSPDPDLNQRLKPSSSSALDRTTHCPESSESRSNDRRSVEGPDQRSPNPLSSRIGSQAAESSSAEGSTRHNLSSRTSATHEADTDSSPVRSVLMPHQSQSPASLGVTRKTSLGKSATGAAINRKDTVRIGSPLRHVAQLGPGLQTDDEAMRPDSSRLYYLNPKEKTDSIPPELPTNQSSPASLHALGLSCPSSSVINSSLPLDSSNPSMGSPTPRRKSALNPSSSSGQLFQNLTTPSLTGSSSAPTSAGPSKPSTGGAAGGLISIPRASSLSIGGHTHPTSPQCKPRATNESTKRRTSDPSKSALFSAVISPGNPARPSHHHSSPSISIGTGASPSSSSRNSSPISTYGSINPPWQPSHAHSSSSAQSHIPSHSLSSSLSQSHSTSAMSNSPTRRRNSLIFTANSGLSSSPTNSKYQYNRSALSAALAHNATSAPPFPPVETIKLQRVPTSVRTAQDLRLSTSAYPFSSPSSSIAPASSFPLSAGPSCLPSTSESPAPKPRSHDSSGVRNYPNPTSTTGGLLSVSPVESTSSELGASRRALSISQAKSAEALSTSYDAASSWSSGFAPPLNPTVLAPGFRYGGVATSNPSLASPITFSPASGVIEGISESAGRSSAGKPSHHYSSLISHGSSPTSPYQGQSSSRPFAGQPGSSIYKPAGYRSQRDRSSSSFSLFGEDGPNYHNQALYPAGTASVPASVNLAQTEGSQPSDDLSMSPFSMTGGYGAGSGGLRLLANNNSEDLRTNISSVSTGNPPHHSSASSSSCSSNSNRPVISIPTEPPQSSLEQRSTSACALSRSQTSHHRAVANTSSSRRTALRNHRMSVIPSSAPSTEDFAKIIMQSRTAKVHKWKQQQQVNRRSTPQSYFHGSSSHSPTDKSGTEQGYSVDTLGNRSFSSSLGLAEGSRFKAGALGDSLNRTVTGRLAPARTSAQHLFDEDFPVLPGSSMPERKGIPDFNTPELTIGDCKMTTSSSITPGDYLPSSEAFPISPGSQYVPEETQLPSMLYHRRPSSVRTVGAKRKAAQEEAENGSNEVSEDELSPCNLIRQSSCKLSIASTGKSVRSTDENHISSSALKEIEWVDWLDDYRRMKEAKLRAESEERRSSALDESSLKGKGKEIVSEPETVPLDSSSSVSIVAHPPDQAGESSSAPVERLTVSGAFERPGLRPLNELEGRNKGTGDPSLEPPASAIEFSASQFPKALPEETRRRRLSLSSLIGQPSGNPSTTGAGSNPRLRLGKQLTGSHIELGLPGESSNQSNPTSTSSSLRHSSSFYGGKIKKNFNLGKKIDDWWNAVRSSFVVASDDKAGSSEGENSGSAPGRRSIIGSGPLSAGLKGRHLGRPSPSRFTHAEDPSPTTDDKPKQASSLKDGADEKTVKRSGVSNISELGHAVRSKSDQSRLQYPIVDMSLVPSGALAPLGKASRPNENPDSHSPGSATDKSPTSLSDARRRNPQLTLKLGSAAAPKISEMINCQINEERAEGGTTLTDLSTPDLLPKAILSTLPPESISAPPSFPPGSIENSEGFRQSLATAMELPEPTPVLSPTGNRLWERTPGLVLGNPFRLENSAAGNLPELGPGSSQGLPSSARSSSTNRPLEQDLSQLNRLNSTARMSGIRGQSVISTSTNKNAPRASTDSLSAGTLGDSLYQPSFSMLTIRQHIKRRLANAKAVCDSSLRAIVLEITTYVETEARLLREQDRVQHELALVSEANQAHLPGIWYNMPGELGAEGEGLSSSVGSDEMELINSGDGSARLSDRALLSTTPGCSPRQSLSRTLSIPTDFSTSPASHAFQHNRSASIHHHDSSEPSSTPSLNPQSRTGSRHGRGAQAPGPSPASAFPPGRMIRRGSIAVRRGTVLQGTAASAGRSLESPIRATSRSVCSTQYSESVGPSSRSTSRSRSPLPRPLGNLSSNSHRRSSPLPDPNPKGSSGNSAGAPTPNGRDEQFYNSPYVAVLQEISSIATEILDTPVGVLASKSHACVGVIHQVQQIGKSWDENPSWPHRGWYVRMLLAIAGLSRVLEWWDAEKGFWNFAPEDEDDGEEIRFFATRSDAVASATASTSALINNPNQSDSAVPNLPEPNVGDSQTKKPPGRLLESFILPPPASEPGDESDQASFTQSHGEPFVRTAASQAQSPMSTSFIKPEIPPNQANLSLTLGSSEKPPSAPKDLHHDFKKSIDLARTETILAEVSLEDSTILYLSPGWTKVTGLDPQSVIGAPFGELIDGNYELFNEANRRLMEDVGNTVELQFTIKISVAAAEGQDEEPENRSIITQDHFLPVTAKGMLMLDRETGEGSHSMWAIRLTPQKPAPLPSAPDLEPKGSHHVRSRSDPVMPALAPAPLSTEPLLCRICEHYLPAYYFERHNETCAETHRLEMHVSECNERLSDLKDTIRDLRAELDRAGPNGDIFYAGLPLQNPTPPPSSALSPLNPSRASISSSPHQSSIRSGQKNALEEIEELLNTALDISTPSSEEVVEPQSIENLRLLSPNSENKLTAIAKWSFNSLEDPALVNLAQDVLGAAHGKCSAVNRMRNTILYAERIRMEWEAKVQHFLKSPGRDGSPARSAGMSEELYRPRSAPQKAEERLMEVSSAPRRSSSTQCILPTKNNHGSRLAPINVQAAESKRLEPLPLVHSSGLGTPPRSPRVSVAQGTDRRGSSLPKQDVSSTPAPTPISPRIPSAVPGKAKPAASIKDFDMLKPISKGAFGQVWLAKKKTTGDYYAIKILKKQDMISKNQIMNVKSERKILMNQADSDFVVKLFYTFSSRDHLYLVMEYLNGGDCAALLKALGNLPEEWTRNYVAEVVMGLEYLHSTGVVHRDLKPDNLLIDHRGHLKLTDFGLSKIGLLGRQAAEPRGSISLSNSLRDNNVDRRKHLGGQFPSASHAPARSSASSPDISPMAAASSYFLSRSRPQDSDQLQDTPSESSKDSDQQRRLTKSHLQVYSSPFNPGATHPNHRSKASDAGHKHFVGTPDYLAPESILGIGMDEMVDWWALGVICYEFLYGIPPFHDVTPDKVFDNILSRRLEWPESDDDISPEAIDFMDKLMCADPKKRLGAGGASEVKTHAFLVGIDWENLFKTEASFVPSVTDPESTDYFDPRGATQVFHDDDDLPLPPLTTTTATTASAMQSQNISTTTSPRDIKNPGVAQASNSARSARGSDDFGTFNFKNLPVLERANEEVIRKLRGGQNHERLRFPRHMSLSGKLIGPTSPTDSSNSSSAISFSRPHAAVNNLHQHGRRPSEQFNRVFGDDGLDDPARRNSMPSRVRRASFSGTAAAGLPRLQGVLPSSDGTTSDLRGRGVPRRESTLGGVGLGGVGSTILSGSLIRDRHPSSAVSSPGQPFKPLLPSTMASPPKSSHFLTQERTVDCLVAEDNPISSKVLETILTRFGCRCVVVPNGAEAISCAMGDVAFDVIFMDLMMPIIEGQDAARMIKSTQNPNAQTPIVAVTSFESYVSEQGTLFAAILGKPVQKKDVLNVMKRLGFVAKQTKKEGEEKSLMMSGSGGNGGGNVGSGASGMVFKEVGDRAGRFNGGRKREETMRIREETVEG